jgi:uncharacterized DUF497 family protein
MRRGCWGSGEAGDSLARGTEIPYIFSVTAGPDGPRFEWDDRKAYSNLATHGVSFEAAAAVFDDPLRLEEDDRFAEGEYRTVIIGQADGPLLTVVYTEPEENLIRLISARRATATERKAYEHQILHP